MNSPPYFGRAWTITVQPMASGSKPSTVIGPGGMPLPSAPAFRQGADTSAETWTISNSSWKEEALRITFDIELVAVNQAYWYADIAIYNCIPEMPRMIQYGDLVTVSAGYQNPAAGLIWKGPVLQPLWERVDDTDYRLVLRCVLGLLEDESGQVNVTIPAGMNAYDAVTLVANRAGIQIEYLDPVLKQSGTSPRREVFSGRASAFFFTAAVNQQLDCWLGWNGLNICSLAPTDNTPRFVYAPPFTSRADVASDDGVTTKYTLIGTPTQTQEGVTFSVLLDSHVEVRSLVKIEQALIERFPYQIGTRPPILDPNGLYVVAGIRHTGDTRGNEWHTELTCITRGYPKLFAAQNLAYGQ